MKLKLLVLWFLCYVAGIKKCFPEKRFLKFHKIKNCYKSTLPIISWKNVNNASACIKFARDKNGLAFNFSPKKLKNRWIRNCQVLGCPEIYNSTTLVFDQDFDYYTAYGNFNWTANSSCVKSLGLFNLVPEKMNYTSAIIHCQNLGGDLADVLSEFRTNTLAELLNTLKNWYKAAYVGLDDTEVEGTFQTPLGNFLECSKYRAWGVGQPRPGHRNEDCVVLTVERTWRPISCRIKRPFICELYPTSPQTPPVEFLTKNCSNIKNKTTKRKCLQNNELVQLFLNSSRIDQCALLNDFE